MKELREAVVVEAVRTPTGRSGWKGMEKMGAFRDISAQYLIAAAVEGLVERVKAKCPKFDPLEIEDMAVGCTSQIGEQSANIGRVAALVSGLPDEVAGWAIDRYCNAGLQAVNAQAQAIMCGCGDVMIAAGVEHMSRYPMGSPIDAALKAGYPVSFHREFHKRGGFVFMGVAAEAVAEKYNLTREEMDRFGLWSQQKAVQAMRDEEWYKERVVPVKPEKKGELRGIVDKDELPRAEALDNPEAAWERMKNLEPRFKEGGMVTAGNSSGIVDGAAATMLMSREKAEELGLEPLAIISSMAVAGSEPSIKLLGPIPAMKKALARAGITFDDIDVWEPNEAFASPVLAFCKEFGIAFDDPRTNPTGGAIAIGHPIGCSGVLYFTEMVHWMVRHNLRWGLQTMCGDGGLGIATIVERER